MARNNIVYLHTVREIRNAETTDHAYRAQILAMDKLELLEEMVRFQEERTRQGTLSVQMMVRGKALFDALEKHAETEELRLLARSYRRHLDYELADAMKNQKNGLTRAGDDVPELEFADESEAE